MAANVTSRSVVQQSVTQSAGTVHVQCVPISASAVSVIPQSAGGGAVPVQPVQVLQASSMNPQVVHQSQQYQVIQQQPQQQGNPGLTLIQTASGQLVLQQPQQALKPTDHTNQSQLVINSSSSPRVNYGSVQGVQIAGGIQLQSAVAAQPLVVQQQTMIPPSNRNIIVQTLPVVSAANSPVQLGSSVTHPVNSLLPHRSSSPAASSNPTSDPNGVLIQIGGQTYRVQGVQQVQVVNAVRPAQQQQLALATPSQPSAISRQINVATQSQPSVAVNQLNVATPSQLSVAHSHATLATPSQPSSFAKQITVASSRQPLAAGLAGQTITLTPSQLALLKQTPPEKQLGLIQQFQRQSAQHSTTRPAASSGSNSAVGSPMKTVQIVNSSPQQRTPLPTQTARLSAPTIIRTGPPIAVRVGQNQSSAMTVGNPNTTSMQILRPKPVGETDASTVIGQCHGILSMNLFWFFKNFV